MVVNCLGSNLLGDPSDSPLAGNDRKFSLATSRASFATFSAIPIISIIPTLAVGGAPKYTYAQEHAHWDSEAASNQGTDQNIDTHSLGLRLGFCFAQSLE
jgi:hypothetical protein